MAATLISNAARRLAGRALQPAVRRARMVRTRPLTADETKDAASLVAKIKTRKEELYDLIAHCERNYVVGGSTGLENGDRVIEQQPSAITCVRRGDGVLVI
ncbi:hypothetical protein CFC21_108082 [Triticum aestivum]|uniref:Uncharacterized protein n=3 Tax=Triticinae TaxID=1648030 RepID=A0A3B6TMY4_WHEAT|nr:hypothetical protein CFC21_108082 [Triticum aestivum]